MHEQRKNNFTFVTSSEKWKNFIKNITGSNFNNIHEIS